MPGMTSAAQTGAAASGAQIGDDGRVTLPDQTGRSDVEKGWDSTLDFVESDGFGHTVAAASVVLPAAGAAATSLGAAGAVTTGTMAAAGGAAMSAALPAAVITGAGLAGAFIGDKVGGWIGDGFMGSGMMKSLGYNKMGDAENPATINDPIAHVSKWATLGAMALGAVAAIGVAALIFFTAGAATPFVVVAASAAFAGGVVGGIGAGFASAAGQYGKNKGKIVQGSPDVFFEGLAVARVTDLVECDEHGGPQHVAEGAETVFANGWPIARVGHRSTCNGKINAGKETIGIDLKTSAIRMDIDGGWTERLIRSAVALADFLPIPGEGRHSPNPGPTPKPDGDFTPPRADAPDGGNTRVPRPDDLSSNVNGRPDNTTTCVTDPVDVGSGQIVESRVDIAIPATIPLVLKRHYRSGCDGIQGRGWSGSWAQHLRIQGNEILYQDPEGVLISFHTPQEEVQSVNVRFPHLKLLGARSGAMYVYDRHQQLFFIFGHRIRGRVLLTRIEDRNGNKISLSYDEHGLKEVRHSDGFSLSVESRNMLIRRAVLNAPGSTDCGFVWTYTTAGLLSAVNSAQTGTLRYSYDEQERITSWADSRMTRSHYEYGPHGRVIRNWSDSGHMGGQLDYDLENGRTFVTDSLGAVTIYDWNAQGLVWRKTDAEGGEWLTEWGRNFNVVSTTDPLGNIHRASYDAYGDVVAMTGPDGHSESWSYYLSGRVQSHVATTGAKTGFRYDNNGNLVTVELPEGGFVRYRRAANGQILRADYPGERQERYAYDQLQRPRMITTIAGYEQHMHHDAEGRLVRFSDEVGAETRWDFTRGPDNPRGNMRQVTAPDGAVATATYDAEGLRTSTTDPDGSTRHFHHGALDLLLGVTDPEGHRIRIEHDSECRIIALVNEKGERHELTRNALGLVTAERDFSGLVTRFDHDAAGRMTRRIQPDGTIVTFRRDGRGLAEEVVFTRGAEVSRQRFAYDGAGRLLRASDAESLIEVAYDLRGNVVSEKVNGREIKRSYSAEGHGHLERKGDVMALRAALNPEGLLASLQIGDHAPLEFSYDPRGLETMRRSSAGFALAQGRNLAGALIEQIAGPHGALPQEVRYGALTADGSNEHVTRHGALMHRTYQWDQASRAVAVNDRILGESRFSYDRRGQVSCVEKMPQGESAPVLRRFGYDPNRNLTEIASAEKHETIDSSAGRVKRRGAVFYRHDDAGRVIEKRVEEAGFRPKIWQMQWDARGRLVRLATPEGSVWRYVYDVLGRRIQRLKLIAGGKEGAADAIPEGGGRAYQWEGMQIVAEAPILPDGTTDWGQAAHWIYEPDSHRPLARASGDGLHYVVTDHIGTPRELFTEDGSAVAFRQELSLWGEVEPVALPRRAANDDTAPVDCPIRFQGQWQDAESGLHYNCMRYYDPDATQYLSPDPLGLGGGIRTQAYVGDPNGWVDPLGLAGCSQTLKRNMMRAMGEDPYQPVPGYQAQHLIPGELSDHPALQALGYDINDARNGEFLRDKTGGVSAGTRHYTNHHGYTDAVREALDRIDLTQSKAAIAAEVARLQDVLRYYQKQKGVPIHNGDMTGNYTTRGAGRPRGHRSRIGRERVHDMWEEILIGKGF